MAFAQTKRGLQMNDFQARLEKMAQMYPGKLALVKLPRDIYGRVIDFHKAPVKGYHNPKKDLIDIELMVRYPDEKAEGGYLFAPTNPPMFRQSRTDCVEIIGVA